MTAVVDPDRSNDPVRSGAPLSRICNSARNIRQFAITCGEIASLSCRSTTPHIPLIARLPKATYFDSRIDYRIANPDDVPDGNTIAAQPHRIFRLSRGNARNTLSVVLTLTAVV
ncbi:MAG: hypothetical protein LBL04_08855 [Bacteroidales bacterium]|nr:hypothetical protein [Bacteroidales bacterium]